MAARYANWNSGAALKAKLQAQLYYNRKNRKEKITGVFSPKSISGLQYWFDASDLDSIVSSSGSVSQWNDKSGLGRHLKSTGTNQPTTGTRTSDKGKNVLDFSVDDFLQTDPFTLPQPHTIIMVAKVDEYVDGMTLVTGGVNFTGEHLFRTTGGNWQLFAGLADSGGASDTLQHVHACVFNGAESSHLVDGTEVNAGANTGPNALDSGLIVGARPTGTAFLDGYVAELFGYNRVLTAVEFAKIKTGMSKKW